MSDCLVFAEEELCIVNKEDRWKLFIVDDDKDIHEITKIALKDLKFKNKAISFESAFSAEEAISKLKNNSQFAIVLLDIGMETSDAGLDVANFIRQQQQDRLTRIIIRTGQPGNISEKEILNNYDINGYQSKIDPNLDHFYTSIHTAISQYHQISELANVNNIL